MKVLVQLRQKSNIQLTDRLSQIRISIIRFQGYNKGACQPPAGVVSEGNHENTMFLHKLRKEQAQILTILNERKSSKEA
jgi:ribosomal protein L29